MLNDFRRIELNFNQECDNKIKVKTLCSLIETHPYKEIIYKQLNIKDIEDEWIYLNNIDLVYNAIRRYQSDYSTRDILAYSEHINTHERTITLDGKQEKVLCFKFEEYVEKGDDELMEDLEAIAIYNSKNHFFGKYDMSKYANSLLGKNRPELAKLVSYNVGVFKNLAKSNQRFNRHEQYRLVEYNNNLFLRGITSLRYYEYGIDFAFVISMLHLYKNTKKNGVEYTISWCSLNESLLELLVCENHSRKIDRLGNLNTVIKISTNDLGWGTFNISAIYKLSNTYLFPRTISQNQNSIYIHHGTSPKKVFSNIAEKINKVLNGDKDFEEDLKQVTTIKSPNQLREIILQKVSNPRSQFKQVTELSKIFSKVIDDEITDFQKLLEMCNKAEMLSIDFDLKDKLRYLVSDIIIYGRVK